MMKMIIFLYSDHYGKVAISKDCFDRAVKNSSYLKSKFRIRVSNLFPHAVSSFTLYKVSL